MKKKPKQAIFIPCNETGPQYVNPFSETREKQKSLLNHQSEEYRKRHGNPKKHSS
jgi:hypothetical protein